MAEGKMPHPKGLIEVKYANTKERTEEISLPNTLT
jgi:hypothetical protein